MRTFKLVTAVVAVALALSACGSSASTPGPGGAGPTGTGGGDLPIGSLPAMPAAGGGSCQVSVIGDVTASWTAKQDLSSVMLSYWLSPSNRTVLSLKDGEESLILNCQGTAGSVNFLSPSGTTSALFPKSPKSYVIPVGGILGGADPGEISMLFNLKDKSIWKVIEAGTFNVTTFGGGKFAGTFSAKVGKVGEDLKTVVATATLSGSFEMGCPGSMG